jgi:hypothetical protein
MKKVFFTFASFLVAATTVLYLSSFKGSEIKESNTSPYVLVEIYEVPTFPSKGVHIHWGGKKTEFIPFKDFKIENIDDNGDIIVEAINKITLQGYELDKATSGLADSGMITKLFFKKK